MGAALAQAPVGAGDPVDLARGDLRWRMAVAPDGHMPFDGAFPALIQWQGAHPATRLLPSGCALRRLIVTHPDAAALQQALSGMLRDPRVVIENGDAPALRAEIATPQGLRVLA
jgi:hypothetical protein